MSRSAHYDAIVIGVGAMGSSACYYLAARGKRVLGLEQFDIVHERGSHAGQSRIIRKAYFEHPDYVPLLERAYQNWEALERKSDHSLYHRTGIFYLGPPAHPTLQGIKTSSSLYHIPIEQISAPEFKRFPALRIPPDFEALFEPDAGFLTPEIAIRCYAQLAIKQGAEIQTHTQVMNWQQQGAIISVTTQKSVYTCDKLIVTAGSWTSKLLPTLPSPLKVTQQVMSWINPKAPEKFSLANFPCWFIEDPEKGMFYGFPLLPFENFGGPIGLKIASHRPGPEAVPDTEQRATDSSGEEDIRYILEKYFDGAGTEIITTKSCLYTYSADEHFIVDFLPECKQVVIACGFSGHGFKFVSVIGEILAELAIEGKSDLPVAFLGLERFKRGKG